MTKTIFSKTICLATAVVLCLSSAHIFAKGNSEGKEKRHKRPEFSSLDQNSDSAVSLEEFKQHNIPFGDHQTVFNSIDSDGDGMITEQEFKDHKPPRKQRKKRDESQGN